MGKSSSKLNKLNDKRRSQSIAWSFRFSTLNKKKMAPIIITQNPHRDINVWLDELDLRQYKEQFSKFIGVEELIHFCEADIKRLGVRNSAHRARIVSSLVALRENYRKGTERNSIRTNSIIRQSQRHSVSTFNDHHIREENDPSSPIYELLTNSNSKQKQSKSVGDLIVMDNHQSPEDTLALKKALEWELSLDSRDLRSHAWYHGPIPRQRAEECCQRDGDFLIRDCVSQPGNFVLTCKTKGPVLHFVINKILIQPETVYERVQYQFEDDAYDTVPDLITFYVGSGKAISVASGARIQTPCNRSYPLSFYATKYGTQINSNHQNNGQQHQQYRSASPLNSPSLINAGFRYPLLGNYTNSYRSPMSSPPRTKRDVPPRLPSKKHRSQSLTPNQPSGQMVMNSSNNNNNNISNNSNNNSNRITTEKYSSGDGVIQGTCTEMNINPSQINLRSSETRRLLMSTTEKCNSADGIIQNQSNRSGMSSARSSDERSSSADGIINNQNKSMIISNNTKTSTLQHGIHRHHSFQSNDGSGSTLLLLRNTHKVDVERSRNGEQLIDNHTNNVSMDGSNDNNNHSGGSVIVGGSADDAPSPPPKPNRSQSALLRHENGTASTIDGPVNRIASYHASGSDSGNGSGDSVQSSSTMADLSFITNECTGGQHRGGVIIKNPRFLSNSSSLLTLKNYSGSNGGGGGGAGAGSMMGNSIGDFDVVGAEDALMASHQSMLINNAELQSKFDIENFSTLLLPSIENKPLDNSALNTIRIMLSDTGPRVIANHLTRIDIALILGDLDGGSLPPYITNTDENYINYLSGVELIAIEQGQRFRQDLLERTECIRLLVAITILTCSSDDERAETLNKWIQVAIDTKTALGNLYGFCAIMLGLCMPQIQKLEPTWHILRQKYTDSAFNFEAKLRPTLKNMNDCSNPQAPNTTVPHLLPYILLRDRGIEDILDPNTSPASSLLSTCITPWETNSSDFGLTILFAHLDSIRSFTKNISLYKRNAQIVLEDSSSRLDELLEDAFRTEFHLKFLWGSKGALADAIDRHTKLEQVLSLMAEKFCSSDGVKIYN